MGLFTSLFIMYFLSKFCDRNFVFAIIVPKKKILYKTVIYLKIVFIKIHLNAPYLLYYAFTSVYVHQFGTNTNVRN